MKTTKELNEELKKERPDLAFLENKSREELINRIYNEVGRVVFLEERVEELKIEAFKNLEYREGQMFKRKTELRYPLGCSTYTGDYKVVYNRLDMHFTDGISASSDFCEPVEYGCLDCWKDVQKDIEIIERETNEKIRKILDEFIRLKVDWGTLD